MRQRAAIEQYAAVHGFTITRWFEEKGVCGAIEWESRPAWCEMMESLNGTRTIIVERLDRLARDLMVSEHILADLRARNVTLVSTCEDDIDSDNPTRVLVRQVLAAIAGYDRSMTVLKLRGARQRMKAKTGRCEGRKPYGHKDGEQPVLARMKALQSAKMGPNAIARALNAEGLKPRDGAKWYAGVVDRILKGAS